MSNRKKVCKWAGVIYVLTNLVNGKQYVGKTEDCQVDADGSLRRWLGHIKSARSYNPRQVVHRAIRKHGAKNFSAEIVQRCRTVETLCKAEIHWIKKLRSKLPAGYNVTNGGEGVVGNKWSLKARKNLSQIGVAQWQDPAYRANVLEAHKRRVARPEEHQRLSKAARKLWRDDDYRANHKAGQQRRIQRKDDLQQRSRTAKAQWLRADVRTRTIATMRDAWDDAERRSAMSALKQSQYADPSMKRKLSEGQKKRFECQEAHANASIAAKKWMSDPVRKAKWLKSHQESCHSESRIKACADGAKSRFSDPQKFAEYLSVRHRKFYGPDAMPFKKVVRLAKQKIAARQRLS